MSWCRSARARGRADRRSGCVLSWMLSRRSLPCQFRLFALHRRSGRAEYTNTCADPAFDLDGGRTLSAAVLLVTFPAYLSVSLATGGAYGGAQTRGGSRAGSGAAGPLAPPAIAPDSAVFPGRRFCSVYLDLRSKRSAASGPYL